MVAVLVVLAVPSAAAERIGIEDLFANPQFSQPSLSPDGRSVALMYRPTISARKALMVVDLETLEHHTMAALDHEGQGEVFAYYWLQPDVLMYLYTREYVAGEPFFHIQVTRFDERLPGDARHYLLNQTLESVLPTPWQDPRSPPTVALLHPLPNDGEDVLLVATGVPIEPFVPASEPDQETVNDKLIPGSEGAKPAASPRFATRMEPSYVPPRSCDDVETFAARHELDLDDLEDMDEEELDAFLRVPEYPHVIRLNVRSGAANVVEVNPGRVVYWLPDHAGAIRLAITLECDLSSRVLYRRFREQPWEEILVNEYGGERIDPMMFHPDGERVYVFSDQGRITRGLFLMDLETQELEEVYALDDFDMQSLIYPVHATDITGVRYTSDRSEAYFLDLRMRDIYGLLQRSLPGMQLRVNASTNQDRMLITAYGDQEPGMYYLFDRPALELRQLFAMTDRLDGAPLVPMEPVVFEARDGLELQGYVTRPEGVDGPTPTVVMVHGGPFGVRDAWGFHPEVQLLANRGYSVVQVNFRGSGGFGREFLQAGWMQWGESIQDDIADATRWVVREGIADPDAICIYGGSFGGYAAIMNVIRYPELYRCAVSWAGVMDLETLVTRDAQDNPYLQRWHRLATGDAETDVERLREGSPVHRADEITVPVFIAHGERDEVVPVDHSRRLVEAMRAAGRSGRSLFQSRQDHSMSDESQRIQFYEELDEFLARYLDP